MKSDFRLKAFLFGNWRIIRETRQRLAGAWLVMCWLIASCQPSGGSLTGAVAPLAGEAQPTSSPEVSLSTAVPTRPAYAPGELVDYIAQTGDTLPALAVHFNTSVAEILAANPFIPANATTLPPGMPMRIPIYYAPFWGPSNQIIPDSLFVNGPAQVGFDLAEFVSEFPGWIKDYRAYAAEANRSGAQIIELVAKNFSISPRLLLALLEYQAGALSRPNLPASEETYLLGNQDWQRKGVYLQLVWAANTLNNGYYGWRTGKLATFEHLDGRIERPDPWQNAASVALQYYFSRFLSREDYERAVSPAGFGRLYTELFGDTLSAQPHLPGSLQQPEMTLPFLPGITWAYTGGPHTAWGDGEPLSAVDFAPGSYEGGCTPTDEWATAVAPGVVARSEPATVVLDLDMDGDERTGWTVFYFHLATEGRASLGKVLQTGDPVGHPSCEGGRATGTHVHIARKYNGEWIPASGALAFNLDGWVAQDGSRPYLGFLVKNARRIIACDCADQDSQIQAGAK